MAEWVSAPDYVHLMDMSRIHGIAGSSRGNYR